MSDLDLDRLGDVWREQPDPGELEELRRAAETVRRRARWAQLVDIVAAVAVAAVVALLAARNPEPKTLVVGGGAILILLASQIRQRKLRIAELKSLTGSREEMLDQSIERVRLSLKRVRFGALTLAPAFLLGLLVAYAADPSVADLSSQDGTSAEIRLIVLLGVAVAMVLTAVSLLRSHRRNRRELERLLSMRESYLAERSSSVGE